MQTQHFLVINSRFYLTSIMLLTVSCVLAQKSEFKLSDAFNLPDWKNFRKHLYSDATSHYVYFQKRFLAHLILEKYDSAYELVYSKELIQAEHTNGGLYHLQDGFVWSTVERNAKEDFMKFFLAPVSFKGELGPIKPIYEYRFASNKWDSPEVNIQVLKNKNLAVFTAISDFDRSDRKTKAFLHVFDAAANKLWEKNVEFEYNEEELDIVSWQLLPNGEILALGNLFTPGHKLNKEKWPFRTIVFKIAEGQAHLSSIELKLENASVNTASFNLDNNKDIICVGFYANDFSRKPQGVFHAKLSFSEKSVIFLDKKAFNSAQIAELGDGFVAELVANSNGVNRLNSSLSIKEWYLEDDNSMTIVAEEHYEKYVAVGNSSVFTTFSHDIIVLKMTPQGTFTNIVFIPKRVSGKSYFASFSCLKKGDDIYLLYNDDENNLKKNLGDEWDYLKKEKQYDAVLAKIDKDGNLTRNVLFTYEQNNEIILATEWTMPSYSNEFGFIGVKNSNTSKMQFVFGSAKILD